MPTTYYYVDLDLRNGTLIEIGTSPYATHTGNTGEKNIHRVFLTKGQFNKLQDKVSSFVKR